MMQTHDRSTGRKVFTVEKYDTIGKTYTATRRADSRIIDRIIELFHFSPSAKVVDIGAGTGNYSLELAKFGYQVMAVEPSLTMRQQGTSHPLRSILSSVSDT